MTILQLQKETKTPSDDSISIDSDDDLYNSVRTEEAIEWCNRAIGRNPYDSDNYLNKSSEIVLFIASNPTSNSFCEHHPKPTRI